MSAPANLAPARGARTPEPEADAVDAAAGAAAAGAASSGALVKLAARARESSRAAVRMGHSLWRTASRAWAWLTGG